MFRQDRVAPGIVLVRLAGLLPEIKAELVAAAIGDHAGELFRSFTVIMPDNVRIRRKVFCE